MHPQHTHVSALLASLFTVFSLTGCGGGESDSGNASMLGNLQVATFIDSPVDGLEFLTDSTGGVTDTNGNFFYRAGEEVTFRIGNLYLGKAKPKAGKVTPLDLVPDAADASDARVTRILQTLQSIDTDGDPENGIEIAAALREQLRTTERVDLDTENDADTDTKVKEKIKREYRVSADVARKHYENHKDDDSNEHYGYQAPSVTTPSVTNSGSYTLVAWNDLGMHCVDGKDYSVFSILPPYNNLHAHLINRTATSNKQVSSGVTVTYEAWQDADGSINTSSIDKTNFWDWVLALFGAHPADDHGLNLTPGGPSNPTPSTLPSALTYNSTHGWWEAEGIPITPYDDAGNKNFYPMVKVVAKNSSGAVLASTKVVLPVSDEMSCKSCHSSSSGIAAKPTTGWVNDADPEKDWKKNILKLHDQKYPTAIATAGKGTEYAAYGSTLLAAAEAGKPSLCASCHKSNALGTAQIGTIKPLTEALHAKHATVKDPGTGLSLDNIANRDSCYLCHPGSATKCLRGAMGNAKNADGSNAMDCQSCHGNMSAVGKSGREGWLEEPGCQQCHDTNASGQYVRLTSAVTSSGLLRTVLDSSNRFGTNPNTPASGTSLYRFSKGHGNLQCEACHGATHAIYPSSHANDNVQSIELQGHAGTLAECVACHSTVPSTTDKGPHGMHTVGQAWVKGHEDVAERNAATCKTCHGSDYRGHVLSRTFTARTFSVEGRTKTYAAGQQVGCYDCHNGPGGD